ncbi:tyrosine-type recombinase/integrase [Larkinella humicola]|uniref:Site-specific integrase n=1 Tax=Larkinella humicola TaxID=2607654 RepID=A0A5N1JL86_9BACT|nr:phage integrase SAM-like domain-containing protein [Larkinella humicola]KAA9357250.1 site-specific integrase [Larkinella humicola]
MPPPSRLPPCSSRQRVSLKLTFDFPPHTHLAFDELQCLLRVDDQDLPPYGSGIYLLRSLWNSTRQQAEGPTREARVVNRCLSDIRADHLSILLDLQRSNQGMSPALIQRYWLSGERISVRLLPVYEEYLTKLHQAPLPERNSPSTLYKWNRGYHLLTTYLNTNQMQHLSLDGVSIGWAKTYYSWLRQRPLSIDSASRYIGQIREILQYSVEQELITCNKLSELHLTAEPAKTVYCLTPQQVQHLAELVLPEQLNTVRNWALLSCYTGLDFKDAVQLVRNPAEHLVNLPFGQKIVIRRQKFQSVHQAKPDWGVSHIPLLPEAKALLEQAPELPTVTIQRVNRNLETIQKMMDLPFRLTTKICRKTAGALFLLRGYRTEAVQKILGIQHLRTLERNYLHIFSELVDENMQRLGSINRTETRTTEESNPTSCIP